MVDGTGCNNYALTRVERMLIATTREEYGMVTHRIVVRQIAFLISPTADITVTALDNTHNDTIKILNLITVVNQFIESVSPITTLYTC